MGIPSAGFLQGNGPLNSRKASLGIFALIIMSWLEWRGAGVKFAKSRQGTGGGLINQKTRREREREKKRRNFFLVRKFTAFQFYKLCKCVLVKCLSQITTANAFPHIHTHTPTELNDGRVSPKTPSPPNRETNPTARTSILPSPPPQNGKTVSCSKIMEIGSTRRQLCSVTKLCTEIHSLGTFLVTDRHCQ